MGYKEVRCDVRRKDLTEDYNSLKKQRCEVPSMTSRLCFFCLEGLLRHITCPMIIIEEIIL